MASPAIRVNGGVVSHHPGVSPSWPESRGWHREVSLELFVALRKPPTIYFPHAVKVADHSFAPRTRRKVSVERGRGAHLLEPLTRLGIGFTRASVGGTVSFYAVQRTVEKVTEFPRLAKQLGGRLWPNKQ